MEVYIPGPCLRKQNRLLGMALQVKVVATQA